jgi:cytochrome b561
MQLANSKARYGAIPQTVHWLTFLCVIAGWSLGWFLDYLPKGPVRSFGLLTHMTLGQCVFVLVIVRLTWRFANPPPRPEMTRLGPLLEKAAKINHYALYALLLAVPFLGVIVQLKRGDALPIFELWHFASPWPVDRALAKSILKVHEYLANTLLILAGIHACAALMHHYVFRDRTLVRMVPGAA